MTDHNTDERTFGMSEREAAYFEWKLKKPATLFGLDIWEAACAWQRAAPAPSTPAPVAIDDATRNVLDMFMSLYRAKGWEGDMAYQLAERILAAPPTRPDGDARDAARYRWLRKWDKTGGFPPSVIDREIEIEAALAATPTPQDQEPL
jgi:hypothetical protein